MNVKIIKQADIKIEEYRNRYNDLGIEMLNPDITSDELYELETQRKSLICMINNLSNNRKTVLNNYIVETINDLSDGKELLASDVIELLDYLHSIIC